MLILDALKFVPEELLPFCGRIRPDKVVVVCCNLIYIENQRDPFSHNTSTSHTD